MKKYLLGLFAIALAVGFSAFTKAKTEKSKFTTVYFRLAQTTTGNDNEAYFETVGSWTYLGPSYTGCTGSSMACIVQVDDTQVPLGSGTEAADFVSYLQGLIGSGSYTDGATQFINTAGTIVSSQNYAP